jgi:hypothetical protein
MQAQNIRVGVFEKTCGPRRNAGRSAGQRSLGTLCARGEKAGGSAFGGLDFDAVCGVSGETVEIRIDGCHVESKVLL